MNDKEQLVQFLGAEVDRARAASRQDCPDDALWAQLEDGLLAAGQRDDLLRHIARCGRCRRRASSILIEMDGPLRNLPPTPLIGQATGGFRRVLPALCALAAVLTVAVGAWLYQAGQPGPSGLMLADASLPSVGYPLGGRVTRDVSVPAMDEATYRSILRQLQPKLDRPAPSAEVLSQATRAALTARFADEAADFARRWVAVAPNDAMGHNATGLARFQQKRFEQALESFEAAVRRDPGRPAYLLNAAMAAEEAGQLEKAVAYLQEFLNTAETGPEADRVRRHLEGLQAELQ